MTAWLLPENIEDVLPPQAWRMEDMRRALLDLFRGRGYQLVIPPLMEYVDSLLTGVGADLDLKTFKLVDQLSGRLMGVRADITPQVARIDAHLLDRQRSEPPVLCRQRAAYPIGRHFTGRASRSRSVPSCMAKPVPKLISKFSR